ncbi:DNA primase catalytic core, N-terminal domain family protein [Leptolyngbya boryana NIES-2135]|jgi:DNA primase|uniref:DNA primase n=1 Tax=Leptolyngbya boryana NIES-2135 TaxID=1973484 RepID=A0A1Z4JEI4_LEPBY|nr:MULTISPECIES: DNA primase [Leptolyngbya]BAY55169.1 DNA primase catalytic core, N-terminal domain family protein [Leptolyngbya boryana NIES-2135]MBD2369257.1 DNA primase [Leptolyngbya sp. FACHB-161]MBD2375741.1 DNA primase [Leptolyngbya sp. FACHB-238]MBD2401090.1 DNA primase [Leptolyngbya sp. FACHB-239]MBD2406675.1 DNA primase [Leptolyngbya sp. FACHB-402]
MNVPRLHPDTIEQVKQRADIVDVVSEHVVLKKQGKDFVGLCPFHDDKSPSFTVSPSKQFYYCFSCGAGGNTIKFLMELGKRNFSEVVLDLARKYQVPVQTLQAEDRQELQRQLSVREQLYEILAITAKFYEHALQQPQGADALAYLRRDRKLSVETIQQFQLGYAPAGWDILCKYLVEQKKYPIVLLEKAGLLVPRKTGDGYYDRFRNRLMVPIQDSQGRVIGFGGRTLTDEQPKYLNSPETELFDKGRTLFGLDKAKSAIAKQDQAVVVEGYFDVIALHAAGVTNAVASLGTALSIAQVKQLLRYTESKRVVFNFDADRAGVQAAERAIGEVATLAYQGEVQLRVLNLPDGKDPDDFLKNHSAKAYQDLLDHAPLWLDWQINQAISNQDLKQSDQFQQAVMAIVALLGNLPNPSLRTHYIHHCSELLSQGNSRLTQQIEENLRLQVRGQRWHGRSQKWQTPGDRNLLEECEAQLLRLYLHAPEYRVELRNAISAQDLEFSLSHHRFLWRQITDIEHDSLEVDLLEQLRDRTHNFPREMSQVYSLFELDEKTQRDILRAPLVIRSATAGIERVMCEKRYRHFLDLWQKTDLSTTPDLGQFYQQKAYVEKQRITELDRLRQVSFVDLVQAPIAVD